MIKSIALTLLCLVSHSIMTVCVSSGGEIVEPKSIRNGFPFSIMCVRGPGVSVHPVGIGEWGYQRSRFLPGPDRLMAAWELKGKKAGEQRGRLDCWLGTGTHYPP